jgi:murein DD-endopeptidase MepM/ murein hydrolase activator NlpD
MSKVKYYFNTHSLKYEKVVVSIKKRLLSALAFVSTAGVFATLILLVAYSYFDSPKEKKLKREINNLSLQYEVLNNRLKQVSSVLKDMEERDDNIYRVIFEAEPISANVRNAGFGGVNKYKSMEGYGSSDLVIQTTEKLDRISKQMYIQSKSFDEVFKLAKNKTEMLASIPAIQPISRKNLKMIASGFGYRIDPLYKTVKMHTGLDFAAAIGTPIYASGNGTVRTAQYEQSGYGNCVVISHGYGYQTLYGHMSRMNVRPGQKINRGDIIGYIGSTGKSTGPHLHYEVIKGSTKINPVNFFYNDLTPVEYQKMLEVSSQNNQSFD